MQPQGQIIQQGPIVITQNAVSDDRFQQSALAQMRVLSILQMIMGGLCFIFGIVLVRLDLDSIQRIGYGIWIGGYFIIVGGIGVGAVRSNTRCWIISAMVLNIICSSLWCAHLVGMSAVGIISTIPNYSCDYHYNWNWRCLAEDTARTSYALNGLMVFMGVAEFVITIWSAVLCCGAVCRCCRPVQRGQVLPYHQYPVAVHGGQQSVAMYPGGQPMAQGRYMYPAGIQQQPVGYMAQPLAPPTYYASAQSAATGSVDNHAYEPNKP